MDYGNLSTSIERLFDGERAFATAKGTMLNGEGIGERPVIRYLTVDDESCPRSTIQVREA